MACFLALAREQEVDVFRALVWPIAHIPVCKSKYIPSLRNESRLAALPINKFVVRHPCPAAFLVVSIDFQSDPDFPAFFNRKVAVSLFPITVLEGHLSLQRTEIKIRNLAQDIEKKCAFILAV
jgi:hypothetical protein